MARGFAAMDRARVRALGAKGGKLAHERGKAHRWTSDEAREAGRKGGLATKANRQRDQEASGALLGFAPYVANAPGSGDQEPDA